MLDSSNIIVSITVIVIVYIYSNKTNSASQCLKEWNHPTVSMLSQSSAA